MTEQASIAPPLPDTQITIVYRGDQKWFITYARLCDVLYVSARAKVWHVFDSDHWYLGNFPRKRDALEYIDEQASDQSPH